MAKKTLRLPSKPHRIFGLNAVELLSKNKTACAAGKRAFLKVFGNKKKIIRVNRANIRHYATAVLKRYVFRLPEDVAYLMTEGEATRFSVFYEHFVIRRCPADKGGENATLCTCTERGWEFVERYICGPQPKKK